MLVVESLVLTVAVTDSQPVHTTLAAQRLDPATASAKDNTIHNGAVSNISNPPAVDTKAAPHPMVADFNDGGDKILVGSEEPPPIKPLRAAPGMSATSGPLEDFPEGEFR